MEMADHQNFCPHYYEVLPCSRTLAGVDESLAGSLEAAGGVPATAAGAEGSTEVEQTNNKRCMIWTAGANLTAGDEICVDYRQVASRMHACGSLHSSV
jgi:thymidine phosphorylase